VKREKLVGPIVDTQFLNIPHVFYCITTTQQTTASLAMNSTSSSIKRSIRFANDEELCVYYGDAVMDIDEVCESDIWYNHSDRSYMKRDAILVTNEANRCGFGSLLTNTYGRPCAATQDALNTWSRLGNSRRGLERFINSEYSAQRADIRRRTIQSVLRAQDQMREENLTEPDNAMNVLSGLSQVFSRDSTDFSLAMGIADEFAILNVEEQEARHLDEQEARQVSKFMPRIKGPRKIPKSPIGVMAFGNTNCRYVPHTVRLAFADKEQPFFL
jgi:hypothetical protein